MYMQPTDSTVAPVKKTGLDLLYRARSPFKVVFEQIEKDKKRWWKMLITMEQKETLIFVGYTGRIRLWKSLNNAIQFVNQVFPYITSAEVKISKF